MRLPDLRSTPLCWILATAAVADAAVAATPATPAAAPNPKAYAGLALGLTPEGWLTVGDPAAPVTLEEWTDYACPFCARHFQTTLPRLIEDYVRPGQLRLVLRDLPLERLHPTAPGAHAAARCVARQDRARGWAMHDALFAQQPAWTKEADPAQVLESMATGVGANLAAYLACMGDAATRQDVAASVAAAQKLGFSGTPSFRFTTTSASLKFSGALPADDFTEIVDALLAGRDPPVDPALQGLAPYWARAEGLAFDPSRPGFTRAGDAVRGKPTARVHVVEFVDYESAGSRRHHAEVQPALDARWVETGQVAWVTKNLPMRVHRHAPLAAVAAVCAAQQGRLRDMQGLLFAEQSRWAAGPGAPDAAFRGLAARAGLELPRFEACLGGRDAMGRVLGDVQDARGVADRAPTFVLLTSAPGGAVTGPVPLDEFNALLEKALARSQAAAPTR